MSHSLLVWWAESGADHQPSFAIRDPLLLGFVCVCFVGVLILCMWGARHPREIVRWHARFSRAIVMALYGPDWEGYLERLGRGGYLEYLRRAPLKPECFPERVVLFRVSWIIASVVVALLLACVIGLVLAAYLFPA